MGDEHVGRWGRGAAAREQRSREDPGVCGAALWGLAKWLSLENNAV